IGGPTAAFIPVVFVVIQQHGMGGLILSTLMAGLMLVAAGLLRLGTLMRYMPQPVITGFTAGIAVSSFSSQVKDALGLEMGGVPAEVVARWQGYAARAGALGPAALVRAVLGLARRLGLRRWRPSWPGFLRAPAVCTVAAGALALAAGTIGSRFGDLPAPLPQLQLPRIPFEPTHDLLP